MNWTKIILSIPCCAKNIPFSRMLIRQVIVQHDQYLANGLSAKLAVSYKELNPVF